MIKFQRFPFFKLQVLITVPSFKQNTCHFGSFPQTLDFSGETNSDSDGRSPTESSPKKTSSRMLAQSTSFGSSHRQAPGFKALTRNITPGRNAPGRPANSAVELFKSSSKSNSLYSRSICKRSFHCFPPSKPKFEFGRFPPRRSTFEEAQIK